MRFLRHRILRMGERRPLWERRPRRDRALIEAPSARGRASYEGVGTLNEPDFVGAAPRRDVPGSMPHRREGAPPTGVPAPSMSPIL